MTIAIDFDGTCVVHDYPEVGRQAKGADKVLRQIVAKGHRLLLYTSRSYGKPLDDAIKWFKNKDIPLFAVQKHPSQTGWLSSPKPVADIYIDDRALGCPVTMQDGGLVVDWYTIREMLEFQGVL